MIDGCYDIKPTATNKKLWVIVEVYLDAVDRKDAGGGQRSCYGVVQRVVVASQLTKSSGLLLTF
jgi:hypothetical protein